MSEDARALGIGAVASIDEARDRATSAAAHARELAAVARRFRSMRRDVARIEEAARRRAPIKSNRAERRAGLAAEDAETLEVLGAIMKDVGEERDHRAVDPQAKAQWMHSARDSLDDAAELGDLRA
jgi:hypothetical protein